MHYNRKNKNYKEAVILYEDEKKKELKEENIALYSKVQKRHYRKGEFFMVNIQITENLKNITGLQARLLFLLLEKIDYNNRIKTFRQKTLAEELKTGQSRISLTLKELEKLKIIYRDGLEWYFNEKYIKGAGD